MSKRVYSRAAKPYLLLRRPTETGRSIYYVKIRRPEGGYRTKISTTQTSRAAADAWVLEHIKDLTNRQSHILTFGDYAEGWWTERSEYVRAGRARGRSISRGYCDAMQTYLTRHLLPPFSALPLPSLSRAEIEHWVLRQYEAGTLSPTTINHALGCLRIMLGEAQRLGQIPENPVNQVQALGEQPVRKSALTLAEARELFLDDRMDDVWGGNIALYTANLLAASTGMRMGEVQGLQRCRVHTEHVDIVRAWGRKHGLLDTPKWGSSRVAPIPARTRRWLTVVMTASPFSEPEALVLHQPGIADRPLGHKRILTALYAALDAIGVEPEQRKARNLGFHSWRYFFNTAMRSARVPDAKVRRVTGHKTEVMTEAYTRFQLADFSEIAAAQEALLDPA